MGGGNASVNHPVGVTAGKEQAERGVTGKQRGSIGKSIGKYS